MPRSTSITLWLAGRWFRVVLDKRFWRYGSFPSLQAVLRCGCLTPPSLAFACSAGNTSISAALLSSLVTSVSLFSGHYMDRMLAWLHCSWLGSSASSSIKDTVKMFCRWSSGKPCLEIIGLGVAVHVLLTTIFCAQTMQSMSMTCSLSHLFASGCTRGRLEVVLVPPNPSLFGKLCTWTQCNGIPWPSSTWGHEK